MFMLLLGVEHKLSVIGTVWGEIIEQIVFNQCFPPWGACLSRGVCLINIKQRCASSCKCCSRFYSGRCDVTWAARVRSSWAKRSDGSSSTRAATHMQRELNRRGWPQGEKAIERLHGKKRQHPTNRTTQQKLTQQHFLRFVFTCYFETTHSRVQRTQVIVGIIGFFCILPDFFHSPLFCTGTISAQLLLFFPHVGLGHNAILDIRLYIFFLKFQHKIKQIFWKYWECLFLSTRPIYNQMQAEWHSLFKHFIFK